MQVKSALIFLASASVVAAGVANNEKPAARLFGAPSKPTGTPPAGYGFTGKGCFDFFECFFAGDPAGVKCTNLQCVTPLGSTSTKSSTKSGTKTSTKPGSTSTTAPLPSGVPAGYSLVPGRACFDSFDCLLGDFTDTKQKCVQFKCYSSKPQK